MKSTTQFDAFEDRRMYPRLNLQIPVRVKCQNNVYVNARLHDISPDGLQLRCDQTSAELIHPSGEYIVENNLATVTVGFNLPQNDERSEIIVQCSICHFTLLTSGESNEVVFGLLFKQFKDNCRQRIKLFFISEMEPG